MDPYSTHLEALVETAMHTTGPILEMGCGDYSTPILAAICKAQGRKFVVQASNKEWAAKWANVEIVDWGVWHPPAAYFGMVFLDNEESVRRRIRHVPGLLKIADRVVLHDADIALRLRPEIARACVELYKKHTPWTAVLA